MTPPAHNLAELELADRARSGDQDALVELYGRYRETLYRHAWRMLRSDAAAQDMVQEAFARAIASLPQTRQELHFRAWMLRIVTNLCLRELTRGQRDAPYDRDPDLLASERRELDPQQARQQAEIGVQVQRALDALPDRYRQILLLREVEELSYDELAEVLALGESSVKVTLHRARARFAAEFLAARVLDERDAPRLCAELRAIIGRPSPQVRSVVRHLESCAECKQQEQRSAAELLALLPPLPAGAAALATQPTAGSGAAPGASVAGGAAAGGAALGGAAMAGASLSGVSLAAAIAAVALIGGAAIAVAVALRSPEAGGQPPRAATRRSADPPSTSRASAGTPAPHKTIASSRTAKPTAASRTVAPGRSGSSTSIDKHLRQRRTGAVPAGPVTQEPDPEDAPTR